MNKALIVDDSRMMREVFAAYLQSAGFLVEKAASVKEAQQAMSKSPPPDLIILDVVMDGKSGFEYCFQLKKSKKTCSIPVIICSTKSTQADFMLGDLIGADAYLTKTVEQAEFVNKAKQLISQPTYCRLVS